MPAIAPVAGSTIVTLTTSPAATMSTSALPLTPSASLTATIVAPADRHVRQHERAVRVGHAEAQAAADARAGHPRAGAVDDDALHGAEAAGQENRGRAGALRQARSATSPCASDGWSKA